MAKLIADHDNKVAMLIEHVADRDDQITMLNHTVETLEKLAGGTLGILAMHTEHQRQMSERRSTAKAYAELVEQKQETIERSEQTIEQNEKTIEQSKKTIEERDKTILEEKEKANEQSSQITQLEEEIAEFREVFGENPHCTCPAYSQQITLIPSAFRLQ